MREEYKAYLWLRDMLQKMRPRVIFEIGMCDGHHTEMLLTFCHPVRPFYFGFEADPRNVARIVANGRSRMIDFFPCAVGNVTGETSFNLATPEPGGAIGSSSLSEFLPVLTEWHPWLKCQESVRVQSWRLDDFCEEHAVGSIDFIWMDVQGAERLVHEGAQSILQRTKYIWTEHDPGYKDSVTLDQLLATLPGDWKVLSEHGPDVLLVNTALVTL